MRSAAWEGNGSVRILGRWEVAENVGADAMLV